MATRNIEAIEYRGRVYVSQDDLQHYLVALTGQTDDPGAKGALRHVRDQLVLNGVRSPVLTVVSSPRATAGG